LSKNRGQDLWVKERLHHLFGCQSLRWFCAVSTT
jgi:hypothetical protein